MLDIFLPVVNIIKEVIEFFGTLAGGNIGVGIIIFTIIARFAILPLTLKSLRSSRAMQSLQPAIKEINEKYKTKEGKRLSPEKAQEKNAEVMTLYSEYGVNPAAGCLPLLIQMPIFISISGAMVALGHDTSSAVSKSSFLWIDNLTQPDPFHILPILMVVFQFLTQRMAMPKGGGADEQQRRMNSIMQWIPLIFGVSSIGFPAGSVLYWAASAIFSFVQQFFITGWGSLSDIPGLGFLPVKPIPQIHLQKRDVSQPVKKSWMQRMAEKQAELDAQRNGTPALTGGAEVTGPTPGIRRATTTTTSSNGAADSGADGSRDLAQNVVDEAYRQFSSRPPKKPTGASRKRKQ